jgi:hypothetical protein
MVKRILLAVFCGLMMLGSTLGVGADSAADPQFGQERKKDQVELQQEKQMEKARNLERQRALKQDTEKLLELATELKQYVDKTNENVLSLEVIKKAEEIEKLAKNVKSRMKESVK